MKRQKLLLLLVGTFLLAWPCVQLEAQQSMTSSIDPKADQTLREMGQFLSQQKHFELTAYKMLDMVTDVGQKVQLSETSVVSINRPNCFYVHTTGDMDTRKSWYKEASLSIWNQETNTYCLLEVPGTIDKTLDYVAEKFGVAMPLADIVISDPYQSAIERVQEGYYLGLHDVMGVKCHHLAFRQEGIDWQIWVDAGKAPLPRKLVITDKQSPGYPQFIAIFNDWKFPQSFPQDHFLFKAPKDATQVVPGQIIEEKKETEVKTSK